jgi:hypothetical protein
MSLFGSDSPHLFLGCLVRYPSLFLLGNAWLLEELRRRSVLLLVLGGLLRGHLDVVSPLLGGVAGYVELLVLGSLHDESVLVHALAAVRHLVTELHCVSTLHIIDVVFSERGHFLLLLGVHSGGWLDSSVGDHCLLTVSACVHSQLGCIIIVGGEVGGVDGDLRGAPLVCLLVEPNLVLRTVLS